MIQVWITMLIGHCSSLELYKKLTNTVFSNFVSDTLYATEWYYHLIFTSIQVISINQDLSKISSIIWIGTSVYTVFELILKRNWVLRDTSKKSEKFFFNVFDTMPLGIFIVDKNSNFLFFNEKGQRLIIKNSK